jgi:hypothetical protein
MTDSIFQEARKSFYATRLCGYFLVIGEMVAIARTMMVSYGGLVCVVNNAGNGMEKYIMFHS